MNHVSSEGTLGSTPCLNSVNGHCLDTDVFGTHIKYTNDTTNFGGHYWEMNQAYDARNQDLLISYSGATKPGQFIIELKDQANNPIASFPVITQAGSDRKTAIINLSNTPGLSNVKFVLLTVDPSTTGPNADFFIHQITFRQFPSQVPPVFAVVSAPTTPDMNQILNFNVLQLQAKGELAFASVNVNRDFSVENAVFGFKSNFGLKRIKVELEDKKGSKVSGYVTGINVLASYYELLKEYVPTDVDLSQIQKINIIIENTSLEDASVNPEDLTVEMSLT